jgi:hypothetical protein
MKYGVCGARNNSARSARTQNKWLGSAPFTSHSTQIRRRDVEEWGAITHSPQELMGQTFEIIRSCQLEMALKSPIRTRTRDRS